MSTPMTPREALVVIEGHYRADGDSPAPRRERDEARELLWRIVDQHEAAAELAKRWADDSRVTAAPLRADQLSLCAAELVMALTKGNP